MLKPINKVCVCTFELPFVLSYRVVKYVSYLPFIIGLNGQEIRTNKKMSCIITSSFSSPCFVPFNNSYGSLLFALVFFIVNGEMVYFYFKPDGANVF